MKMRNKKHYENIVLRRCSRYLLKHYILLDQIYSGESEVKKTLWKFLNILGKMEIINEKNCFK